MKQSVKIIKEYYMLENILMKKELIIMYLKLNVLCRVEQLLFHRLFLLRCQFLC